MQHVIPNDPAIGSTEARGVPHPVSSQAALWHMQANGLAQWVCVAPGNKGTTLLVVASYPAGASGHGAATVLGARMCPKVHDSLSTAQISLPLV